MSRIVLRRSSSTASRNTRICMAETAKKRDRKHRDDHRQTLIRL